MQAWRCRKARLELSELTTALPRKRARKAWLRLLAAAQQAAWQQRLHEMQRQDAALVIQSAYRAWRVRQVTAKQLAGVRRFQVGHSALTITMVHVLWPQCWLVVSSIIVSQQQGWAMCDRLTPSAMWWGCSGMPSPKPHDISCGVSLLPAGTVARVQGQEAVWTRRAGCAQAPGRSCRSSRGCASAAHWCAHKRGA